MALYSLIAFSIAMCSLYVIQPVHQILTIKQHYVPYWFFQAHGFVHQISQAGKITLPSSHSLLLLPRAYIDLPVFPKLHPSFTI